jgi:hypothetical protein
MKMYLIEALIAVYIDAERTSYYEKFHFRYIACLIMEFIFTDKEYINRFN